MIVAGSVHEARPATQNPSVLPPVDRGTMPLATAEELWDRIRGELVRIEDGLTTEISAVRFDFAHALRAEAGGVRAELREFRGDFESFRNDALTHFDNLDARPDAQAMEHQAPSAAVAWLEKRGPAPSN